MRENTLAMKDLIEKLSSYNIFNYLLPGVLFAAIGSSVSSLKLLADDIVVGVFLYYFYGLVVSRIGSLVLEPLLKRLGVVRFASYSDFVAAVRVDAKIETLSEQNNTYRTLASTLLCLSLLETADRLLARFPGFTVYAYASGVLLLVALFVWSYRKQTTHVTARVEAALRTQPMNKTTDREHRQ